MSIQTSLCPPTLFLSHSLCVVPSFPPFQHCFFFIISVLCFVCLYFSHTGTLAISSQLRKKQQYEMSDPFICTRNYACRATVPSHTHTQQCHKYSSLSRSKAVSLRDPSSCWQTTKHQGAPWEKKSQRSMLTIYTNLAFVSSVLQLNSANSSSMFSHWTFFSSTMHVSYRSSTHANPRGRSKSGWGKNEDGREVCQVSRRWVNRSLCWM